MPVNRDQAYAAIAAWHRHHAPPPGYRYAVGCAVGDRLVGVATAGRPVSRVLDDGLTIEVTRCATDGTRNACSMLYAACWRAAKAIGYQRAVTYNLDGEGGASLRAAGWVRVASRPSRPGWDMPSRHRDDTDYEPADRGLWLVESGTATALPTVWPERVEEQPDLFAGAVV